MYDSTVEHDGQPGAAPRHARCVEFVEAADGGHWWAYVPELGCRAVSGYGDTPTDAMAELEDNLAVLQRELGSDAPTPELAPANAARPGAGRVLVRLPALVSMWLRQAAAAKRLSQSALVEQLLGELAQAESSPGAEAVVITEEITGKSGRPMRRQTRDGLTTVIIGRDGSEVRVEETGAVSSARQHGRGRVA